MVVPLPPDDREYRFGKPGDSVGKRLWRSVVFAVVCIGLIVLVAVLAQNIGVNAP